MAESLKLLRKRIRSIKNTRQITKAMEMVSATKLRRTDAICAKAMPFQIGLEELLQNLCLADEAQYHPLFTPPQGRPISLYIIMASDRGLCGSFNTRMIEFATQKISEQGPQSVELFLIGKKARQILKYFPQIKVVGERFDFNGKVLPAQSGELAALWSEQYLAGTYREIVLCHYSNRGELRFKPQASQLLPGPKPNLTKELPMNYIFEPGVGPIFDRLLKQYCDSKIYTALLEQFSCEHRNRMITMNQATRNCKELRDALALKINRARQSMITKELLDIVGGAEALK